MDEGELRRRVNPERICGLYNAFAFDARSRVMGMNNLNLLTYTGPERFTMATELLPLHDKKIASAAEIIEYMVNTAPWRISDTFISSVRNKSTVMQVSRPHMFPKPLCIKTTLTSALVTFHILSCRSPLALATPRVEPTAIRSPGGWP